MAKKKKHKKRTGKSPYPMYTTKKKLFYPRAVYKRITGLNMGGSFSDVHKHFVG